MGGSALAAAKFLGIVNRVFKAPSKSSESESQSQSREKRASSGNLMIDAVVNAVYDVMAEAEAEAEAAAADSSLLALDISADALDFKMDDAAQEKMAVMDALHSDDMAAVEMDGVSENYLIQKLVEGGAISGESAVNQKVLIEVLCESEVLAHSDVAVVRASTLILANLVEGFAKEIVSADTLEVISGALSTANILARRFLVRLLSAMATAKS